MLAQVEDIVRDVVATMIMSRYRAGAVNPTIDPEIEVELSSRLIELLPGSAAFGEEAVHAGHVRGPNDQPETSGTVWVIDPIDGSSNFVRGRGSFATMVALVVDGQAELAVIHDPRVGTVASAARGVGAAIDGRQIHGGSQCIATSQLTGLVPLQYLPEPIRSRAHDGSEHIGKARRGHRCVGHEYLDLASGRQDFAIFWHTNFWDHVGGLLLMSEAGFAAERFDGRTVDLYDGSYGLIIGRNPHILQQVRDTLLRPRSDPEHR